MNLLNNYILFKNYFLCLIQTIYCLTDLMNSFSTNVPLLNRLKTSFYRSGTLVESRLNTFSEVLLAFTCASAIGNL